MIVNRPSLPLLALVALLAAAPAAAQSASDPAPDPAGAIAEDAAVEDVIVTAQRRNRTEVSRGGQLGALGDKAAEDVPFSIKSYNEALILNQQPLTLGQLLENDPSIRTTYGFGNAAEQFVVRGFTLYGDDVGMNGLYGITPRQLVAPELYESVQVLNGASAFLNGAAPGGTGIGGNVNLVLKRADRSFTRATASYLSNSHFGGSADISRRFGDGAFGVRVNGAFRSGDVSIDDEFRRTAVVGGAFDWRSGPVRIAIDVAYQDVEVDRLRPKVTIGGGLTRIPRVPDADHNYAQAFAYTKLRDLFGMIRGEWDVAENAMLYASFGARDGDEAGIYDGITVNDATTGAASGNALFVPLESNNEAAVAGLRVKLAQGGISHEINIGGSHLWQVQRTAYDFRYGPGFAGFATNLYDTPQVALPSSSLVGGDLDDPYPINRTRLGSAFASDTIGLFDDRLLVTGGLRLQAISVRTYSYFGGALDTAYSESAVTPVVGIVAKPVEGLSLFANRIESLAQGPTAPATGVLPRGSIALPLTNANAVFAPYRSIQYEVGAKLRVGRMNASLALFTTSRPQGVIEEDPNQPGAPRFALSGEQRNRGIEFSVDGELARGLRLIAGVSVIDATIRDQPGGVNEGNEAQGVPDWQGNANVEWDVPFLPGLTLTGRVVHTGEQQVNIANTLQLPDWTRFDAGLRYVFVAADTPITLRAGVDNIADKRYWASAFDAFNQTLLQGAPRTARASLTVDF